VAEKRENIVLESAGLEIFGMLHLPKTEEKVPCVFFCHGLAGNKIGKDRIYVEIASKLAESGIASFRLDCRSSGDSEGEFFDVLPEHFVEDTLLALKYLESRPEIDAQKMGLMGRSFGGSVAVESAALYGNIKSIVLWCPMFSGEQWHGHWQLHITNEIDQSQSRERMRVNGQQGSPAFFERFMAINVEKALAHCSQIPLLHIHGDEDTNVEVAHADNYARVRKTASASTKLLRLPHTDHDFSNFDEKQQAIQETVSWFKDTLCTSSIKNV